MWSVLVDFIKDFNIKSKKLEVESNRIYTKLFTFMERQSWRLQVFDHIFNLWMEGLLEENSYSSNRAEILQNALLHNEMIIRIYLDLQYTNFKEEYQREMFNIYQYENWAMHLSKEELELCEWIHKFMKDVEEILVPCHELFLKSFDESLLESDKYITILKFFSYLSLVKGGQEYSIRLFYQNQTEQIKDLLKKIDKKAKRSPSLLETYNYTKSDMMTHLERINEKEV